MSGVAAPARVAGDRDEGLRERASRALGPHGFFEPAGRTGVLLIHGITGTPNEMRHLGRKLTAAGFTVACPQLAGHCSSLAELKTTQWRHWYASTETALEFLTGECDRVFVSGISMGALLALKLAAERPESVAGVATLSATFFYDGWNIPRFRHRFLLPIVVHTPLRYFMSYREPPPFGIKDERIRNLIAVVYNSDSSNAPEKFGYSEFPAVTIRETFGLIRAAKANLGRVSSPTLIVHATEDDMASLKNAEFLRARLRSAAVETCYLDDTYHVLTLDRRKNDVANRIVEFIRSRTE